MSCLATDRFLAQAYLRRLQSAWRTWTGLAVCLLGSAAVLFGHYNIVDPWLWLGPATLTLAYQLWWLRRLLEENTDRDQNLFPHLGPGTRISLLRGWAIAAVAGFILASPRGAVGLWLPGLLYLGATLADALDGYLARKTNHVTRLGGRLDIELDALGLLVAPLYGTVQGRLPPWYLLLSAAYYLFQAGLIWRRSRGLPGFAACLRPSAHARMFAGCQMGLVGVALLPPFDVTALWLAATLFMIPVLVGFFRDWLVATGHLDPQSPAYRRGIKLLLSASRGMLPLLTRGALAVTAVLMLQAGSTPSALFPFLWLAICSGTAARAASLGMVIMLALSPPVGLTWCLLSAAVLVLLLGSGWGSFWQPEDRWLFLRHSEAAGR